MMDFVDLYFENFRCVKCVFGMRKISIFLLHIKYSTFWTCCARPLTFRKYILSVLAIKFSYLLMTWVSYLSCYSYSLIVWIWIWICWQIMERNWFLWYLFFVLIFVLFVSSITIDLICRVSWKIAFYTILFGWIGLFFIRSCLLATVYTYWVLCSFLGDHHFIGNMEHLCPLSWCML